MAEIYALQDPASGAIRYIGKAKNSADRLKGHLRDTSRRDSPIHRWLRDMLAQGRKPELMILKVCADSEWQQCERAAIQHARTIGIDLLNVAPGGNQPFCPTTVRAANGRANAVARQSTPRKRRIWELKRTLSLALKQGFVSESAKAKMRYAAAKKPELFGAWAGI